MCRLTALTMTLDSLRELGIANPRDLKAQIVHELMLRSVHEDGGQKDGWGVAQENRCWKSTVPYNEDSPFWMRDVDTTGFILSHMRKASTNTLRTIIESHPYVFDVDGQRLTAAHNGWIDGTKWTNWEKQDPQTDSWRALSDLAKLLAKDKVDRITSDVVEQWLSAYGTGSAYAFLLLWRGSLYALKNERRPLYLLSVGDGYIIHTSETSIKTMHGYLTDMYDLKLESPARIADNNIARFELGNTEIDFSLFHPKYTTIVAQTDYSRNSHWGDHWEDTRKNVNNAGGSGTADVPIVYAPAVTSPRPNTKSTLSSEAEAITQTLVLANEVSSLRRKKAKWDAIVRRLSPMRVSLIRMWAAHTLGFVDDPDTNASVFLSKCTLLDLDLLGPILAPITQEDKVVSPFSVSANAALNWWNHAVRPGWDVAVHDSLFGNRFFWLDFTVSKDLDADKAVSSWASEVADYVRESLSQEQRERWFNTRKLGF